MNVINIEINVQIISTIYPSFSFQFKQQQVNRAMFNPYNPKHREVLHDSFGVQLPVIGERKALKVRDGWLHLCVCHCVSED